MGNSGSLDGGRGVVGGGNRQLRPKCGKLISDVGVADMVRRWGVCAYIGMVEVLWNVCSVVVNLWLKRSAVLHNTLREFIEGRGTGTATLESNMY